MPSEVSVFVCGPEKCREGEHDSLDRVTLYGDGKPCGESVACSKCGSSAFERDMWLGFRDAE